MDVKLADYTAIANAFRLDEYDEELTRRVPERARSRRYAYLSGRDAPPERDERLSSDTHSAAGLPIGLVSGVG